MAAKKSAKGGGTIRQRSDGRWEARFTLGRDPGTGKQIQRSVYGTTQQEVRQKLAQAVAAVDNGTYVAPQRMTVGQWLDIWQRDYLGSLKPCTVRTYQTAIKNPWALSVWISSILMMSKALLTVWSWPRPL